MPPAVPLYRHSHEYFVKIVEWGHDLRSSTHLAHLPLEKNVSHFADNIYKRISLNEKVRISIAISRKCVHAGPIENNTFVGLGDKPLSELILTRFADAYMRH